MSPDTPETNPIHNATEGTPPATLTKDDWKRLREIGHEPLPPHVARGVVNLAAEMGGEVRADIVAQVAEMDAQEEVADAEAKAKGFRDDAERQRLLEEARLQEDAEMDAQEQEANRIQEMLAGQTLPDLEVLEEASAIVARVEAKHQSQEGMLQRIEALEAICGKLRNEAKTLRAAMAAAAADSTRVFGFLESLHSSLGGLLGSEAPATPKAPKASPEGLLVPIESLPPGAFMRRGDARRMLVRANGSTKVAFLSPTKGWTVRYRLTGWMGVPYTPTAEEREAAHASLSDSDRTALGL